MLPTHPDYPPPPMKHPTPHDMGSADHVGSMKWAGVGPLKSTWTPHDQMIGRRRAGEPNPFEGIETFEDLAAYRAACEGHDCPELDTLNLKIKHEYIPHLVQLVEAAKLTHDLMDGAGFWDNFNNHFGIPLEEAEQRRLATDASRRRAVFLHFDADGSPQFDLSELASFDRDLRMFKTQMQDIWADMKKSMAFSAGNSNSNSSAPRFHFLYDIPTLTSLRMNLLNLKIKLMRQPRLFIGATYFPGQPIGGVNLDVLVDDCEEVIRLLHQTGMN